MKRTPTLIPLSMILGASLLLALAISGKQFHLWSQIRHAYWHAEWFATERTLHPETAPDPASPSTALDQWVQLPRVALLYPVVRLAAATQLPADRIFTWIVWIISFAIGKSVLRSLPQAPSRTSREWLAAVLWIALFLVALGMNGRMTFSLLSAALTFEYEFTEPKKTHRSWGFGLALWMASVSSGVLTIAWASQFFLAIRTGKQRMSHPAVPGLILMSAFVFSGIAKNALYFLEQPEGVVRGLLGHGYGVLLTHPIGLFALGIFLALIIWLRRWVIPRTFPAYASTLPAVALVGALFGRATLSYAIPSILLLLGQRIREAIHFWRSKRS